MYEHRNQCEVYIKTVDAEVNLNNIDMLRICFGLKIGYADYTIGMVASIMPISKGVCIIEKQFTVGKNKFDWGHKMSTDSE